MMRDTSRESSEDASEVDSYILDESEEILEQPQFLVDSESEEGSQQLQTVDPETHARLEALLEAAGISKFSSKEGKALTDPEVLRSLTSSVSSALDEATQAIDCLRIERQSQGTEGAPVLSEREAGTVRKLYESGSMSDNNDEGESLLSLACSAGYYELAQVLLAMNANVEDRGMKGDCTPLMEAASGGYVDIVRLLILHGADINAQSSAGNTPLHSAACAGHVNVVKELISHGAMVEVHNENGHTPLMEAASAGHVEIGRLLLEAGAGINTHSNEFKESALTLACYKGHLQMVKFLLSAGADQEHKTDEMHTALMEAAMDGHVEVARLLLDSGAQVNMPAESFESPLTLAACGGHVELASLLIERGANIEEVNDEGYTPLMEAAREGHDDMVSLLLSHNADINAQTEETQETALTLACCGGFKDVAEFLISAGADIEQGCSTPLMEAAQEGHEDLVKLLLNNSANVHAQTGTCDTALTYACENGHTAVAELLLKHGAFLEHESEGGRTPLMKAARAGHLCTVEFLIKQGANVNRSTSTNDHTVLSLACAGGHHQVVEQLLLSGADANHKLKDGSTMIIEASKGGHTAVVKMLVEWPNRVLLNTPMDLAQPDTPHINMQCSHEEPRVPVQGLAHIVPPNEPDSQLPSSLNFGASPGKAPEHQNAAKILGKRSLPASISADGKTAGKATNAVTVENLKQITHEGAVLADLTGEEATEKVETLISNIMAKELMGPAIGSKEEQLQRKQQILEELQKVERELQDKAQGQQIDQQQPFLRSSALTPTPAAVRLAEETAKKVLEMKAANTAIGSLGVKQELSEPLGLTGTPALKDLVMQDLAAALPSIHPNPPAVSSPSSPATPSAQVVPPSPQLVHQPGPSSQVANGVSSRKALKGRNNSGKGAQSSKGPPHHFPLPPPSLQQQPVSAPNQLGTQPVPQVALSLQAEHNESSQPQPLEGSQQVAVQVSAEAFQRQQNLTMLSQQAQAQQLTLPQLTAEQQDQLLQHMFSKQGMVSPFGQNQYQPLPQLLPQVPQQAPQAPQLTQQERAQLYHQTHQAQLLQQQLFKQTSSPAAVAAVPVCADAVDTSAVFSDKGQVLGKGQNPIDRGNFYQSSVDVDSQTESNHDTALTLACAGGHAELVTLLLAKGANIEHRDKKGFTPLILAATAGHHEVVEILLDHSADIEAQSERTKDTPLSLACSGGRYEVVQLLLARGANKEHRNVSDYTPLSLAASGGYVNIIKLLLQHGAEINSRTGSKLGISPLMLAAMNGHTQAVRHLLDAGSDINAQIETNKNTALTLACFQGRHEVVSLLVERKANIEHRAKTGLTPLMEAASGGYVEVGRVLLDKGAEVNATPVPSSRDTALTIAADKGHYRFVELLLHRSASVDVKNKKGNSPLWLACNGGFLDVVQLLKSNGADIDCQDNRRVSCLMAAFRKGHCKVVKWMVKHVTQFPSDTELVRFIATVTDKELQKKCQQCMDIIVSAKDRQAAEANKNANNLLQEIDRERELDEQKRQVAAKRRERRKERKKKGKMEKAKYTKEKKSPERNGEDSVQDQDDDDEEEDNDDAEPVKAPITSRPENHLIVNTEAKSVNTSTAVSSLSPVSASPVTSSFSVTVLSPSTVSSDKKRNNHVEMRKNRRNRKEKRLQDAIVSKANNIPVAVTSSSGINGSFSFTAVASHRNNLYQDLPYGGDEGKSSGNSLIIGGDTFVSPVKSNTNTTLPVTGSKHKRNASKTVSGKSGIGELDFEFDTLMTSKKLCMMNYEKLKNTDRMKNNTSDAGIASSLSQFSVGSHKSHRKDEGWKEVTRKSTKKVPGDSGPDLPTSDECSDCRAKMVFMPGSGMAYYECSACRSRKVTVPSSVVSRVIGRGGCNINSIRESSGAHVDIEKSQKGAVDRVITIKGSPEATRMAFTMISVLVQEPETELADIIARAKGKPAEKNQQTSSTIGHFTTGMFSATSNSSSGSNTSYHKSSAGKLSSSRLSSNSSFAMNGRASGSSGGLPPTNVWHNPPPLTAVPSSPRRSPQKQLSPSSAPCIPSESQGGQDKATSRQQMAGEQRQANPVLPATLSSTLALNTTVYSVTASSVPPMEYASVDFHQHQSMPSSVGGVLEQKSTSRPSTGSLRGPQRETGTIRSDPQPLPIVSSHMSTLSNLGTASKAAASSGNFSTFQLWDNATPSALLSKKEDFASVAAAGVVSAQSGQQISQLDHEAQAPAPNDPTKAPGYKGTIPQTQSTVDKAGINPSIAYQLTGVNPEHHDMHMMNFREHMSSAPSMLSRPGQINLYKNRSQLPHPRPYPGPAEHLHNSFVNSPSMLPLQQSMFHGMGSSAEKKEEYSRPYQPMTLPKIRSTLNPNAPDFQANLAQGGNSPNGLIDCFPSSVGDLRNGSEMPFISNAGNNQGDTVANMNAMPQDVNRQLLMTFGQLSMTDPTAEQQFKAMMQLHHPAQPHRDNNCASSPRGLMESGGNNGQGIGPGPSLNDPSSLATYVAPPGSTHGMTSLPTRHRPSSAPCMPDSLPATMIRPSTVGSPLPPCTPPLADGKQSMDDGKVIRPIGGERASQRKIPFTEDSPLDSTDNFSKTKGMWGVSSEYRHDGACSDRGNQVEPDPPPFPNPSAGPVLDPSLQLQDPQMVMQQMYPNGLHSNLTSMFGAQGSGGRGQGGLIGEGGVPMWNQGIKVMPHSTGESEGWESHWSHTDM